MTCCPFSSTAFARSKMRCSVISWYTVSLFFLLTSSLFAYEPEECLNCHREGSGKSALHISQAQYEGSVHHNEITCMDCHRDIVDDAHMKNRGSGNVDCGACHDQVNRHGLGGTGTRPQCYSCHTRHSILGKDNPASSVHPDHLARTCGPCHPAQTGDAGFLAWLPSFRVKTHGKQDFACDFDDKDCLGCHQGQAAHGEKMPLNKKGCRKCHFPDEGQAGLMGDIHPKSDNKKDTLYIIAGAVYGVAVALLLIGGCCFYTRRFSGKSGKGRR